MNKKILLGMSGGVDSAVSAILLQQKGYEVYGVTMKLWEDVNSTAEIDAKNVCENLGINHCVVDFQKEFKENVISNFICEYSNCRTPNPCIECNKYLKFGEMYKVAEKMGMDFISTGHYAKIEYSEKYGRYILRKAKNLKKDQSYFLYQIPKELLGKIVFPLEDFENKTDIREIAKKYKLDVSSKKDSEDICFITNGDYKKFLEENSNLTPKIGNIVNKNGDILGKHNGLYNYTIGQRKGLGIAYKVPLYVIGFNKEKNEVIVGEETEIYSKEMLVTNINLLLMDNIENELEVNVKTRYSGKEEKAIIKFIDKDLIKVEFEKPVARITPGQSAVFYIEDIVVGGGKILK